MAADQTARDVAQDVLDSTGQALHAGCFDDFEPWFHLPQVTESFEGQRLIETRHDLKDLFDGIQDHFAQIGLTRLERHIVEARFRDPETIDVTHESRLLCHGHQLHAQPYPVFGTLKHYPDRWKIVHCQYAIQANPDHARLFGDAPLADAERIIPFKRV